MIPGTTQTNAVDMRHYCHSKPSRPENRGYGAEHSSFFPIGQLRVDCQVTAI